MTGMQATSDTGRVASHIEHNSTVVTQTSCVTDACQWQGNGCAVDPWSKLRCTGITGGYFLRKLDTNSRLSTGAEQQTKPRWRHFWNSHWHHQAYASASCYAMINVNYLCSHWLALATSKAISVNQGTEPHMVGHQHDSDHLTIITHTSCCEHGKLRSR